MERSTVVLIGMFVAFSLLASIMVFKVGRSVSKDSFGLPEWRIRGVEFYLALAGLVWWGCIFVSAIAIMFLWLPVPLVLDGAMLGVVRAGVLVQMLGVTGLVCIAGLMSGPFEGVEI